MSNKIKVSNTESQSINIEIIKPTSSINVSFQEKFDILVSSHNNELNSHKRIIEPILEAINSIPNKNSQLENDSLYITNESIPTKLSSFENDTKYITEEVIPTKTSQLLNDSDFITHSTINTKAETNLSNITTDANHLITNLPMPHYLRGVSLTAGISYTASSDGWVFFSTRQGNAGYSYITVNGIQIMYGAAQTNIRTNNTMTIPVKKDDIYIATLSAGNIENYAFYPCKGAS